MLFSDIIATIMVQAEARNKSHLAGILDAVGWLVSMVVTFETVTALQGHNMGLKIGVIIFVTAANYIGTLIGTKLGQRWVKADDSPSLASLTQEVRELQSISRHPNTP